jgi:hypothetical protein
LETTGDYGLRPGGSTGLDQVLVQQILKLGSAHLEADGVGVSQIVSDVVDIRLLRGHTAPSAE